jgi:hypothetical protein
MHCRILTIVGAVLMLVLSGCTSTRLVTETAPNVDRGRLTHRQVHDRLQGKSVCVVLRTQQKILGAVREIAQDSIRLWSDSGSRYLAFPTREVDCIERTDHVGGGILGFLGGTVGGLLLGGAIGEMSMPHGGDMRGLGVAFAAVGGAGLGAIGGTIYGAVHGIVNRYEFPADTLVVGTP